jgi:hypothetical protein
MGAEGRHASSASNVSYLAEGGLDMEVAKGASSRDQVAGLAGQTHLEFDRTIEGTLKQGVWARSYLYDNFAVFAGEFGAVCGVLGGS